ncbi:MAG: 50S ribosomal protein L23 [Chloroflexi bacterium]|nr:50S ribosomal protein L23 [Chloroflexota bacterium]
MDSYQVLVRPVITEKNTLLNEQGKYTFEVAPEANKIEVKRAVEEIFKVSVLKVNVLHVPGKLRRLGRHSGMTRAWKKAVVTLQPGQRIELFQGV